MKKQTKAATGGETSALSPAQQSPPDPIQPVGIPPKSLAEQRDELAAELTDVQDRLRGLSASESELLDRIARLNEQIDIETPPPKPAEVIQTYLESQKQLRNAEPDSVSPLDQAFAQRRGRGRPEYPVTG